MILLLALFVVVAVPVLGSVLAGAYRPQWWRWQQIAAACLPMPGLAMAILVFAVFRPGLSSTPERCGVDACGMLVVAMVWITGFVLVATAVGAGAAAITLRLATGRWGGRRIQP